METEMVDKLFLELSQFTKAKTKKEILLETALRKIYLLTVEQPRKHETLLYDIGTLVMEVLPPGVVHGLKP